MKIQEIIETSDEQFLREADGYIKAGLKALGNKIFPSAGNRMTGASEKMSMLRADFSVLATAGKFAALVAPFWTYYKNMSNVEDNYKSGAYTVEQYKENHQIQLGLLIEEEAAILGTLGAMASINVLSMLFNVLPIFGPILGAIFRGLAPAAGAYMLVWLNTDEGRKALASLVSAEFIKNTGAVAETAINAIRDKAHEALGMKPETDPAYTNTPTPNGTTPNAEPTKPDPNKKDDKKDADKKDAAPKSKYNPETDFTPERFKRDANGELTLAYDKG
jgi:hypothetical protein